MDKIVDAIKAKHMEEFRRAATSCCAEVDPQD